ncbi:MAG TPA: helix-turn-helix domain-containing protein [Opitutaceae bacterium]|nr:helix-turn-helix domain-containing protein [Opitutaceae bacterium]
MADKLQSALDRVAAATVELREATQALLAQLPDLGVLGGCVPENPEATFTKVVRVTAEIYQISVEDLLSKSRCQPIATARQMAITIVSELTGMATQPLAERFGLADHNTARWALNQIRARRQNERGTRAAYAAIMARLATGS